MLGIIEILPVSDDRSKMHCGVFAEDIAVFSPNIA
jgi:hypothetical protein|tara:strand:- start:274 stop:378 length:105 start_codon:yes stop_codon:yes gene_type:complete